MCTSLKYKHCFARNFDYEKSYNEKVVRIPRERYDNKYSIIGICAGTVKEYPLLYDAMNEYGLCMGGLAFVGSASYLSEDEHKRTDDIGIAVYDFIMQVLGNNKSVSEVKEFLKSKVLVDWQYSESIPNTDLHWQICDENESIVVESVKNGLMIYDGDVLTNNPEYPEQMVRALWSHEFVGENVPSFLDNSRGTQTYDLKGDYTSQGRFSRVLYIKKKLEKIYDDFDPINQSFHLLSSVEQVYGMTPVDGEFEYTIYSVVYDMKHKEMHIKTYDDDEIFTLTSYAEFELDERYKI